MIALEWKTKILPNGQLSIPRTIFEKLNLDYDSEVRVLILKDDNSQQESDTLNPLLAIDKWAMNMGIEDLSEQHDYYLYGVPKK
jgi:hypothetical protein